MTTRLPLWSLFVCALGAGGASMAVEIAAGRVMTPHVGGTIYTWGALIGAFMAGMSVGYDLGGRAADRWANPRILAGLLITAGVSVGVIPLYASELMVALAESIQDLRYAALLGAALITGLPAALLAATGPYCFKLAQQGGLGAGRLSGRLSACGAMGSIVGTLSTSFYLIPNVGLSKILWILAGACTCLGGMVLIASASTRIAAPRPSGALSKAASEP